MTNNFLPTEMEEVIKKIDNSSWIREIDESIAPYKDIFDEAEHRSASITSQIKKIDEIMTPYKDILKSFSNIGKGKVFVDSFLEKHSDTPMVELTSTPKDYANSASLDKIYELMFYLPMSDNRVLEYSQNILKTIEINLNGEQFQFAYLATHLLFMTYMYSAVWRTSRLYNSRYSDVLTFLKCYGEEGVNFHNVDSIFDYHKIHEGDTFEFLKIIGVDNGYVCELKKLIKTRNKMAHANGNFEIADKKQYDASIDNLIAIVAEINKEFEPHIKEWYQNQLLEYMKINEDNANNFIDNLINIENLSVKELEICSKYGLSRIKNRRYYPDFIPEQIKLVEKLHKKVKEKYKALAGQ